MLRYLLTFLLCANFVVFAQQSSTGSGKIISGVVLDSLTSAALPFANITLHTKSDSSFITGVSSDVQGEFELGNISDGEYYL